MSGNAFGFLSWLIRFHSGSDKAKTFFPSMAGSSRQILPSPPG